MYWLGLDIGTTGSRAVIIDALGNVRAGASADHAPMAQPHPTWAEQDPEDWWRLPGGRYGPRSLRRGRLGPTSRASA